jgi:hypothetical protein
MIVGMTVRPSPRPALRLLEELEFEVIEAQSAEMRAAEVKDLVAR